MQSAKEAEAPHNEAPNNQPADTHTGNEVFDWESGEYVDTGRQWIFGFDRTFALLLAFSLSVVAVLSGFVIKLRCQSCYPLVSDTFPVNTNPLMEASRWLIFAGGSVIGWTSMLLLIHYSPYVFYFWSKRVSGHEVPASVMAFYAHIFAAEREFGLTVLVLVATNLAGFLFPLPASVAEKPVKITEDNEMETIKKVLAEADKAQGHFKDTKTLEAIRIWLLRKTTVTGKKEAERTADILDASTHIVSIVKNLSSMPWQLRLIRLTYLFSVHWCIRLVLALCMSYTAVAFHKRTLQSRLLINRQALSVTKRLRDRLLTPPSATSGRLQKQPHITHRELGAALFEKLCPRGMQFVTIAELREYLPPDQAATYMDLIDLDGNGDISREEFIVAVKRFFVERDYLECSVVGNVKIIKQLSNFLQSFCWAVTVLTLLVLLDETITDTLKMVGGAMLSLTFIFGGTAADAFQSVIFILFSHPFDVGDKVLIDDRSYKVIELGLWTCTFENYQDAVVYICNNEIRGAKIANTRRSGRQTESVKVKVSSATTDRQLERLESEMRAWAKANDRDFEADSFMITKVTCMDKDRVEVDMELTHKSNFQDSAVKNRRNRAFFFALRDTLAKVDIELAKPVE